MLSCGSHISNYGGVVMDNNLDPQFQFLVPEYQNALRLLQERHNIHIRHLQQLTGGRTGALLYLVSVSSPSSASIEHFVLKLDRPAKWGGDWRNEAERHRLAASLAPDDFVQHHMASLAYDPIESEGALAVLYTIAGGSLQQCRPIVSYARQGRLEQIYSTLGSGLLEEWNESNIKPAPNVHPQSILEDWLGYRLHPEQGHIHKFLSEECKFDADNAGLIMEGEALPNPYAFACRKGLWGNTRRLDVLRGFLHGDLNNNNVLIEFSQYGDDLEAYYLIDFANFREGSYLLYDHAYLELSYLLQLAARIPAEKWIEFTTILARVDVPSVKWVPTELAGACAIIRSMREALAAWTKQNHPTLLDDFWGLYRLAATAVGLNFCNKTGLSREQRFAAFVYSASYLREQCDYFDISLPESAEELALARKKSTMETGGAWEPFLGACHYFDRGWTYILVTGPDLREVAHLMNPLGRVGWSLILDSDPDTQTDGLYEYMREEIEGRRSLHLITCEDRISLNPGGATYWYAARGLRGRASTLPDGDGWLAWKLKYSDPLAQILRDLAVSSGELPATCVILWNEPSYMGKICDLATDVFGERIDLIFATPQLAPILGISEAYGGKAFPLLATQIADGLKRLLRRFYFEKKVVSLPAAGRERVVLKRTDTIFLDEEMTLVHLEIGVREADESDTSTGFLYGEKISWFELSLHQDVERTKTEGLKAQVKSDLEGRRITRVNLYHHPGAGGTAVARRVAWDLHLTYPTVLLHRFSSGTIGRLQMLRELTSLPILIVVESAEVSLDALEGLFSTVRSENLAVVFLIVSRRFEPVREDQRVRYLRERLDTDEADRFAEVYGRERPGRVALLRDLAQNEDKQKLRVPFYFGLMAFDKDFTRLDSYIETRLDGMSDTERRITCYIALAYRYGHEALPAQMFFHILGLESTATVQLERVLDKRRRSLLIRETSDGETCWRPSHQLIAVEVWEQILAGSATKREVWKDNLSTWAIQFIEDCDALYEATHKVPSERVLQLLSRLFIQRDRWDIRGAWDVLGLTRRRPYFARLIEDVEVPEGQLSVFRALVEHFPEKPHFWAHLGRHLSWQGDHRKALEAIERSLELDDKDDVLHHMNGMALRNQAYDLMKEAERQARRGEVASDEVLERIKKLWQQAADAFTSSRVFAPNKEHSYVSHIQLLTRAIEFGFKMSDAASYVDFLTDPGSLEYQEKLGLAEELLEDVKHIQGGEKQRFSRYVLGCEARINGVSEDYTRIIEGWTRLLSQPDVYKPPIRRRLAFAYVGNRNRSWDDLGPEELEEIIRLMESNLLAEPDNDRDIRLWFRAARRTPSAAIDSAIERLSYWYARGEATDALYYLYVLQTLKAIDGSAVAKAKAERLIKESRRAARNLEYRTRSYDWLGEGSEMTCLVHYSRLGDWDRDKDFWTNIEPLERVSGLVAVIDRPEVGSIELECGLKAFFVPARAVDEFGHPGFVRERHENKRVSFFLGFSYEGLRAWRVEHA